MKRTLLQTSFPILSLFVGLLGLLLTGCEQQNYEPASSVAPGGGTVSTFKSYTLTSADSKNIYGRIVFYKYNSTTTLVQMGLYNTAAGATYAASIYQGTVATSAATPLKTLDAVSGATGAFATNKYFTISEAGFYDKLSTYNASVKVMASNAVVASGNIGANAAPVAESN
ncbi:hypothetical protein FAES_0046 [Fibrella aestuarina BUZ 2]|uniref:CHRD domain-containing protein n=1 Tax=Fibrella aestuarina BUZ 2 TaxID=1166018 RepID=I0K1Q7_9BACT|nr:hypothetical protein [Fibrella aestuarina]CCG98060.1 hypothetical protein FAES_0046 [Fibrella aestuarina BUZ 2]